MDIPNQYETTVAGQTTRADIAMAAAQRGTRKGHAKLRALATAAEAADDARLIRSDALRVAAEVVPGLHPSDLVTLAEWIVSGGENA